MNQSKAKPDRLGALRNLVAGLACAAFLLSAPAAFAVPRGVPKMGENYVVLKPIIVPIMTGYAMRSQYSVIVVLELTDVNRRIEVVVLKPRLRDRLFRELLQMVTFRAKSAKMPRIGALKRRLEGATIDVMGDELVKSVLILQAYHRALR